MREMIASALPLRSLTVVQSQRYYENGLNRLYSRYRHTVSDDLTSVLAYDPKSWNVLNMFSSIFTHGGWGHIVGNIFFFLAFSVALEGVLGYFLYPIAFITLAASTNIFYSLYASTTPDVLPTVGLSGVVMGVVAMLVFFVPRVKIRWFFLFIVIIKRPEIPAWLVALFYIGSDTLHFYTNEDVGNINLVVHIVGAATGFLFGVLFLRGKREKILDELEFDGSYDSRDFKRARRANRRHLKNIFNEEQRNKSKSSRSESNF